MASTSTSLTQTVLRTPEASTQSIRKNPTLSPMHNVKRVPRDSHHVSTTPSAPLKLDDSVGDACESKLSIETELYTNSADEVGDGESPASASWVGRKVDAIFSPVLSFLQGATSGTATCDSSGEGNTMVLSRTEPFKLEEELGPLTHTEDSDDNAEATSTMTKCDLRKDENGSPSNGFERITNLSENYDDSPTMTNTESSGSHFVDIDGDVTMADYYKLQDVQEVGANRNIYDTSAAADTCKYGEKLHITKAANNHDISTEGLDDDVEEEFNPYLFIKCLPPYQHAIPPGWTSRAKALPPLEYAVPRTIPPICLVLDLDETLVHCTVEPVADADMIFPVEFNGTEYQVHVRCRPFLQEFLEAVSRKFEVVIFTASQQAYADKLLDKIDPDGKFIRHRMFRDSCLPVEGNFLKDLTILGRDLSKAVLVDNSPHAFGYQVDNGIPIESWFDDPNDKELLKLEVFLRTLHGVDDVRAVVRKTFQTHQLVLDAW
eukprot:CAMPEP_0201869466 /NCGR_PEP_ID=MMETSP0902-20130614/2976_1 /ASSEMBLY_ACC=CAM_ASM_000551 /TAXON_ID=420261 /ORGANISM="Thalassiosira antarctica, Strain CCMP982" /LENGTH=489 /DNA_ID=CAMNT_0048394983 /DNA_START=240 /DNA_END=1709 /DNA_ORIENTATION=-